MALGRRKLSNYFKTARLSKRTHVYAFFISLVLFGCAELYGIRLLREIAERLSLFNEVSGDALIPVYGLLNDAALLFFASLLIYSVFAVFFLIVIEQKVGGATVAILAFIDEMRAGNYEYKRELRDGDELQAIMEALKAYAMEVRQKKD